MRTFDFYIDGKYFGDGEIPPLKELTEAICRSQQVTVEIRDPILGLFAWTSSTKNHQRLLMEVTCLWFWGNNPQQLQIEADLDVGGVHRLLHVTDDIWVEQIEEAWVESDTGS